MFSLTVARILATTMLFSIASTSPLATNTTPSLVERSPPGGVAESCGATIIATKLDGDGAPSDTTLVKQISYNVECGNASTCTISTSQSQSFTVGATLGGALNWIDGGFDVSESFETSQIEGCGGTTGQVVCVRSVIPHKRYNVMDTETNFCSNRILGKYVTTSPVNGEKVFKCGLGDECHDMGYEAWDVPV